MPDTPITSDHMRRWNKLIAFAREKGYAGKSELDHNEKLRKKVFDEYNKSNPKDAIPYDLVKPIQHEINTYRNNALNEIKNGRGALAAGLTPDNFMGGISPTDGIFGHKTSQWAFPEAYVVNKDNGEKRSIGFAPKVDLLKVLNKVSSTEDFFKK